MRRVDDIHRAFEVSALHIRIRLDDAPGRGCTRPCCRTDGFHSDDAQYALPPLDDSPSNKTKRICTIAQMKTI